MNKIFHAVQLFRETRARVCTENGMDEKKILPN